MVFLNCALSNAWAAIFATAAMILWATPPLRMLGQAKPTVSLVDIHDDACPWIFVGSPHGTAVCDSR